MGWERIVCPVLSSDATMSREVLPQGAIESKGNERNDHDCKDCVRHQDGEVDRTDEPCALKTCRAVVVVIEEIRGEKEYRNNEGRNLTRAMCDDISRPDE